ncbi:MAG: universal stress protein [Ardenticatenaceae bacterium]|nr:universal stress protein [Anaerolineales bacterium]MCB8923758.1 universal stress protein [Ardenticatenaceae bacterium]MCB8990093.1 universal stress protein [Ardenticatenaceae bacterium]
MYKTILVPLDGSVRAEAILPHVKSLAHCTGAKLVLLTIVDPPVAFISPYDVMPSFTMDEVQEQRKDAENYLSQIQQKAKTDGIDADMIVEYGAIVATIIEVAEREKADLVAMASHGRTGLSRVFYGSVAAGVLQRIDRPLLLIRS